MLSIFCLFPKSSNFVIGINVGESVDAFCQDI